MATPETEIESKVLELATEALETFCEDVSRMFGVEMNCRQQEVVTQTVAQLSERFEKLVAVNIVDSKGILDGTFQLIFDQEGLFTLGGVMVMLPENRILANRSDASAELAESMVDAVGEAGNLLVGSWERVFREGLEGHGHLQQRLPAFVGKPWDESEDKIGLARDEEHLFIPYEMTIDPYPAFQCGVIFPKAIFEGKSSEDFEDALQIDETPDDGPESVDADSRAGTIQDVDGDEEAGDEESEAAEPHGEPVLGPVSEAIREMAHSSASQSPAPEITKGATAGQTSGLLWTCARDIMQQQVVLQIE